VLFPGVALPLHIFEPRYRRMLADCLAGDRRFVLAYLPAGTDERALPAGHVGTVAVIESAEPLPDGRSNIVVRGADRVAIARLADGDAPYHVAEVEPVADEPEPDAELAAAAARVRERFARVAAAARTLADDRDPLPTLGEPPAMLAFAVAGMIDMEAAQRHRLLVRRSALARLADVQRLLDRALGPIEERATVHARARGNGAGPGHHA
jgi:Lon protease-like protein